MLLYGGQHVDKEGHELQIAVGILARSEEHGAGVGAEGPVVVLARTVHAVERLLVEKHHEAVPARDFVHQVHHNLVLVVGEVGLAVDRGEFELVRGYFVVAGLERNAEAVSFNLEVAHKRGDAAWYGSEIVVVELLVLGRIVSHQRASGNHQVWTCGI